MAQLDLIVFGATGFTGKHAVEHLARAVGPFAGLSWGIAGRSKKKLDDVLLEASKTTGADLSGIRKVEAEVNDFESLKSMCKQARVLVNCCGPYRLYGEPVVRAAIEARTHYVDVSGEPQFIETMQLEYGAQARDARVLVVSACGLDSVPNDLGVIYLQQNFGGTLNSVESYLSASLPSEHRKNAFLSGAINYGTWESLVHSLAHFDELGPLRKKLFPERLPAFNPKLLVRSMPHQHDGGWAVPFMGADNSIVYRTQRHLFEKTKARPVQFRAYLRFPNLLYVAALYLMGGLLFLMTKVGFTRQLLLDYPRLFSFGFITKEGPKKEVIENTRFQVELVGQGWGAGEDVGASLPNKTVVAKMSAKDPGYGFTTLALLLCAVTILREQEKIPDFGVLTTGAAFSKTSILKKLQENGTTMEIVEN